MIYRLSLIWLLLFISISVWGQSPQVGTANYRVDLSNTRSTSLVCDPGENPFAGTANYAKEEGGQATSTIFIPFGDTLFIAHDGNADFSGDPNPGTPPGVAYALYECEPYISGPDLASIKFDTCITDDPPISGESIYLLSDDYIDAGGNGFFINQGGFQTFFNNGDPYAVFLAPVTYDAIIAMGPGWEENPGSTERGSCIHVNTDNSQEVILLNEIEAIDINNNYSGNGCTGAMTTIGGQPEYDPLTNYTIRTYKTDDPSVRATSDNSTNTTHNEIYIFDVPEPGEYTVEVEDNVGSISTFQITMTGCVPVEFIIGDSLAQPGDNICMPVVVNNFQNVNGILIDFRYDPSVLSFTGINPVGINFDLLDAIPDGDSILISGNQIFSGPVSVNDGEVAFELCFDVIGPLGSSSPISFISNNSTEIISTGTNARIAYIFDNGSVTVSDGNIVVDVSSICSSQENSMQGGIDFVIRGGTAPYSFSYEEVGNAANTGSQNNVNEGENVMIDNLAPGDYVINITDAVGASHIHNFTIQSTPQPFGSPIQLTNPTCSYSSDGVLDLTISGGVGPYTVAWSTGEVNTNVTRTDRIEGLVSGQYMVTVTDANGCVAQPTSQFLTKSQVGVDLISLTNVTCLGGGNDGSITVAGLDGNGGPYTYSWDHDTSLSSPSATNLTPGNYTVTVTDNMNCEQDRTFEILSPNIPMVNITVDTDIFCPSDTDGVLSAVVVEGTSPVEESGIQWSTNQSGPTITGLGVGSYGVTVTAQDGCQDSARVDLTTQDPLVLLSTANPPSCPGENDGSIQLMISGGAAPYNITWDDGSSFAVRPQLAGNTTYMVTVIDANNCDTIVESIFVDTPPGIQTVFSNIETVSCFDAVCDGQAQVTASGGTNPSGIYEFRWENGQIDNGSSSSIGTNLCKGWNVVTIFDGTCSHVDSVFIDAPTQIEIPLENQSVDPVSCNGQSDGSITVTASGGTPAYTYVWQGGITGPTIDNLPAGNVNVTVTDANSCREVFELSLTEPDVFELLVNEVENVLCPNDSTGLITLSYSGGNGNPITYEWPNGVSNGPTGFDLPSGAYTITATDAEGCTDEVSVNINEPDPIFFQIGDIVEPQCFGFQTVVTIDTAFGGGGALYEFSVNNGPKRPIQSSIPVLGGQTALISVFDRNGCRVEREINISQPAELLVSLEERDTIELGETAIIEPFVGSSLPIDSISWTPQVALVCEDSLFCLDIEVSPIETQAYTLTVFDSNGCSGTDNIIIEVDKNRNVFIPNAFSPNGDGLNDKFKPYVGAGVERINFFRVFDRWGELVYENASSNYLPQEFDDTGWDGRFGANGKRMNPGVFVYLIEVAFTDGKVLLYRGDVTLLY